MSQNLIHVKLEYEEALQSKKDVLSSELGLIKIAKAIKQHRNLRSDELKKKLKFYNKLKELKKSITTLQQTLPKLRIPNILKDGEEEIYEEPVRKKKVDNTLEAQLQEIQNRLKKLG